MANVIFKRATWEKFDALAVKDANTLYWISDRQMLYKGDVLYGTGANASEMAAGLLSAEDYTELKKLVAGIGLDNASAGQIPTMGTAGQLVWGDIALRRDNDYNYKKTEHTFVPVKGEVCFVDVAGYGLRVKVGDGVTTFAQLAYMDEALLQTIDSLIVKGYYYQGQFYADIEHTVLIDAMIGRLYIEAATSKLYTYNGVEYTTSTASLPNATAEVAGIMKLYDQTGQNTDGTMTQKAITNELSEKFEMDVLKEEEMIVFDNDIG